MSSGPQHYELAEQLLAPLHRGQHGDGSPIVREDDMPAILLGIGHAILAAAAATALNVRRNGAVEAVDEAAAWERVLG